MALSKTHILISYLASMSVGKFQPDIVSYSVLPDAIRCFNFGDEIKNNRVISHFEVHPVRGVASGMVFPTPPELKILTDGLVSKKVVHVENDYNQIAIGDITNIGMYVQYNADKIPEMEFKGVFNHLLQDQLYDDHIRRMIDTSRKQENEFSYIFTKEKYDSVGVRKLIGKIEEQEFKYLSKVFFEVTKKDVKKFFEEEVFPNIRKNFCQKMADTTIRYITFDDTATEEVAPSKVCEKIVDEMIQASTKVW